MSFNYYYFKPNFVIQNSLAQTVFGSCFLGDTVLPDRKIHKVMVDECSKIILFELLSNNPDASIVLLAHGMGGSSESAYIKRIAFKLWIRGFSVFMMNHRGSGLGIGLSKYLWNGGVSDDLEKIIDYILGLYPEKIIDVVGFSLSGNILLKYLGEKKSEPAKIRKALAVNPPIDLKRASLILSKTKKGRLFNSYFMKPIHLQGKALAECFPGTLAPSGNEKTILEFDIHYTAPAAKFNDVDDYYSNCSAKNYLKGITVPTTILSALDDPFVESDIFKSVRMSSAIRLNSPDQGGHMGYISSDLSPWGDCRWMDFKVVDWSGEGRG
jgi:predicted alpha/beta-fold hydrolase